MRDKQIENLKDYKYGFSTDIESFKAPKGLNEEVIRFISNIKKEPKWLLDWRLKAFERLKVLKELLTYFTLCTCSFQLGLCHCLLYTSPSPRDGW